jgi:hypothetical protein
LAQQTALAISKIPTRTSFTSGVVLSTGDVTKVPAPMTLYSVTVAILDDTDLENNLYRNLALQFYKCDLYRI